MDDSEQMLRAVESRLRNLATLKEHLHYLLGSIAVVLIIIILLGFIYLVAQFKGDKSFDSILILFQVAACGALGGSLSVARGVRKLEIDPDSHWAMNALTGGSRILIAIVGSLFVYFEIASKLILGTLFLSGDELPYAIYAFSIVAGFSESFVPNILSKVSVEKSEQK